VIEWEPGACCGVVLASPGYPGSYATGLPIDGLDDLEDGVLLFQAGTKAGPDPRKVDRWAGVKRELMVDTPTAQAVLTAGGRVLTVAARGTTMAEAREKVYRNVVRIKFEGCHFRRDIALREL